MSQIVYGIPEKGINVFHAWNGNESFYIYTQNGRRGIDAAQAALNKQFGKIYLSWTTGAVKTRISNYFK